MFIPKAARINAGLSREEVAKGLGIALSTYDNKETGRSSFSKGEAVKFAELVHIPESNIDFLWSDRHKK